MRCTNCDYPLWNLKARQCPECGTAFRPTDYEFIPDHVQFCCPHCDKAYFATAPKGHLQPRIFDCVQCQRRIEMDEMVVRPAAGIHESDAEAGDMPWLVRASRGRFRAFFTTVGLSLIKPAKLIRGTPPSASVGESIVFGAFVLALTMTLGGVLPYAGYTIWWWTFWGEPLSTMIWGMGWSLAILCALTGWIPLWALTTHAVLKLTGGSAHSLDRTFVAMGYSSGANALSALPLLGPWVGWIWWLTSATIMVKEGQRVGGGRAVLAVLALPIALITLGIGVPLVSVVSQYGLTGFDDVAGYTETDEVEYLTAWVSHYGWSTDTGGPQHALELHVVSESGLWWSGAPFCFPATRTRPSDIPVGEGSLEEFLALGSSDQLIQVAEVLKRVPDGTVAHRFGDFIFVHHGADLSTGDPELWVVVMLPDPDVNGPAEPHDEVLIGLNDLTVVKATVSELAEKLTQQNAYRASIDLPALPDLTTVTHGEPAIAAPPSESDP